jgi:hypothetical protein
VPVLSARGREVVLGKQLVEQLAAVAVQLPGLVLLGGEAEGHGAAEGEDGSLPVK